jgi:hypothetical protein
MASLPDVLKQIVDLIPWPPTLPADKREQLLTDIESLAGDVVEDVVEAKTSE